MTQNTDAADNNQGPTKPILELATKLSQRKEHLHDELNKFIDAFSDDCPDELIIPLGEIVGKLWMCNDIQLSIMQGEQSKLLNAFGGLDNFMSYLDEMDRLRQEWWADREKLPDD